MNAAIAPDLVSETEVRDRLQRPAGPLLLNFTAGWCQPCKSFAPVLGALQRAHGDRIEIMRVDVDAWPGLAREFQVRGVPVSILVRDGVEQDRFVGAKPEAAVVRWLAERGVALAAVPADDRTPLSHGAFYGDDSLKQFLVERLYRHMDQGQVKGSVFPSWQDGSGSVSAALVHHPAPEVFEAVTGLPYGFAFALEFLRLEQRRDAQDIFAALAPGQEVGQVPLRLIHAWLGADTLDWTAALDAEPYDTLRQRWLALSGELLGGADIANERWIELARAARALNTGGDAHHQLEDDLATMVEHLSPPSDARDIGAWGLIFRRAGFAMARLAEHREGWTKEDIAKPLLRHRFFEKHVPVDAEGGFDRQLFEAKRAEWEADNAAFLVREAAFMGSGRFVDVWTALYAPFRPVLVDILRST